MKDKVNEIKISYKEKIKTSKSNPITNSSESTKLFYDNWDMDTIGLQETFKVLLLNNSNRSKAVCELSKGSITGTIVDLRILFAITLKTLSVGIIIAHNHPSGKLTPSASDKHLTNKIKNAAAFFDIKLLDHLIIAPDGSYFSFSDNGLL